MTRRVSARGRALRVGLVLGAALALGLVGWRAWNAREQAELQLFPGASADRPRWVVVADFTAGDTPVSEDVLVAAHELVTSALETSRVVTPIPRAELAREAVDGSGRPRSPLDVELARDLAHRAAASAWIAGRIDTLPGGYSIAVQVHASERGTPEAHAECTVRAGSAVVPGLDRLARDLRAQLGESAVTIAADPPLTATLTPSFAAYRLFVRAEELHRTRRPVESRWLLHEALAIDPEFGSAWKLLGLTHLNTGQPDSARAAFETASTPPRRLSERERLATQNLAALLLDHDLQRSVELYAALAQLPGADAMVFVNHGNILFLLGRYEEALAALGRARAHSPFGPGELLLANEFRTLLQLGRFESAADLLPELEPAGEERARLELAVATSNWERAEACARRDAAVSNPGLRIEGGLTRASLRARRGETSRAAEELDSLVTAAPSAYWARVVGIARVQLGLSAGVPAALPATADSSLAGTILRGIAAAASGESSEAEDCVRAVRAAPLAERRLCAADAALLEAWNAARNGRWDESVRLLSPLVEEGPGPAFTTRLPIRWLVAVAHERSGRLDDAVRAYESVLAPEKLHGEAWAWRALPWPFAHQRLAVLLARQGREAEARRHLEALEEAWTSPDPAVRPLLDEARNAVTAMPGRGVRRPGSRRHSPVP